MNSFETINIKDINPVGYNPRKISDTDFNKLSNSISEFGVINPIILNLKNNHIIGGHQRYSVLLEEYESSGNYNELYLLRLGDIGWVFPSTDLSVKDMSTEKAMNLALNKISGDWDIPKLENLLIDLDVDEFNLDLTGFDSMDIKEFNIDLKHNIKLESLENEEFVDVEDENLKEYVENDEDFLREHETSEMPKDENYLTDPVNVKKESNNKPVYSITIYCDSQEEQEALFNDLELMGIKCLKNNY